MKNIIRLVQSSMMILFITVSAFPQSHDAHNAGSDKIQKNAAGNHKTMKGGMMMDGIHVERHFIEKMIPHHQDAIDMAKLALEKSKKSEIRKLSQDIISSQAAEIETMKKWYKEWFGTEVPANPVKMNMKRKGMGTHEMMMDMSMSHDMMGGTMDDLRKAPDFDKKFLEMMVKHHKGAVMMSGMLVDSKKPEMRKFGKDIITVQSGEIEMMITWYQSWYGSW